MQDKFTLEPTAIYHTGLRHEEILRQVEFLRNFYFDMGYDTDNIKTIFSLTLSYLKGSVNKLLVKSFFDVLMQQNKLNTAKEINLLNCFDDLIDNFNFEEHYEDSSIVDMQLNLGLQA